MQKKMMALLLAFLLLPLAAMAADFDIGHTIAYMDAHFTCGCSRGGSGTMISRYGLVTAAHNLYCHQHSKPLKYCNFYFGARSAGSCWYEYSGKFTYRVYDTFQNGYDSRNDIGYVVFQSPVGDETGWCGYATYDNRSLHGDDIKICTYDYSRHLVHDFSMIYKDRDSNEAYWLDWIYGTEGGPVCIEHGDEYSNPRVVAVYTSHRSDGEGHGYGRCLTSDILRDMREDGAFR